jgi:hypothetical protein
MKPPSVMSLARAILSQATSTDAFSRIADDGADSGSGYQVRVIALDNVLGLSDRRLVIKIDVEDYECNVLLGMNRTIRDNRCIIQVETFKYLDRVRSLLATEGYEMRADFFPNFVFSNNHL